STLLIRSDSNRFKGSKPNSKPLDAAISQTLPKLSTALFHSIWRCASGTIRAFPTAEYIGPAKKLAPSSVEIFRQSSMYCRPFLWKASSSLVKSLVGPKAPQTDACNPFFSSSLEVCWVSISKGSSTATSTTSTPKPAIFSNKPAASSVRKGEVQSQVLTP